MTPAENIFKHLIGAILASEGEGRPFVGNDAPPWHVLLERISSALTDPKAFAARPILQKCCEKPEDVTDEQRRSYGAVARALFEYADAQAPPRQDLVNAALRCVCRTLDSDPGTSAQIIRRCLVKERLADRGYTEMFWVTSEIERMIPSDAGLVRDIYVAVFAHRETSTEAVPMGGQILTLISNRKQDYELSYHRLAEAFPTFLQGAPEYAFYALVSVVSTHIEFEQSGYREREEETFDWDGTAGRLSRDHSSTWDEDQFRRHYPAVKMLGDFEEYMKSLAEDASHSQLMARMVHVAVTETGLSAIWRRLLRAAAMHPETLGMCLAPATWSSALLTNPDTSVAVGQLLRGIFGALSPDHRQRVEEAILAIPQGYTDRQLEWREHVRDRLLGCLDSGATVTPEATSLIQSLCATGSIPGSQQRPEDMPRPPERDRELEYWGSVGVPIEEPSHQALLDDIKRAESFVRAHLNDVPTPESAGEALPELERLCARLRNAASQSLHERLVEEGELELTRAAVRLARMDNLGEQENLGRFTSEVLLRASRHPRPKDDESRVEDFDSRQGAGEPSVRGAAAEGLIHLAANLSTVPPDVLDAIERLAEDSAPAVRLQIASSVNVLYRADNKRMWRIIQSRAANEESLVVLAFLVGGPLGRLAHRHPAECVELAEAIYRRAPADSKAQDLRHGCLAIFSALHVSQDNPRCAAIIEEILADIPDRSGDATHLVHLQRDWVAIGESQAPRPEDAFARRRSLDLMLRLLQKTEEEFGTIQEALERENEVEVVEALKEKAANLARLLNAIAENLYHGSGAYRVSRSGTDGSELAPDEIRARLERLYHEGSELLDELTKVGVPAIAYHVLETLEQCVQFDPPGAFRRIAHTLKAGEGFGYQYESLGVDLFVKLTERYLAEYREVFAQDGECRQLLMDCLDIFVEAGWPSAFRLVYRIADIFR